MKKLSKEIYFVNNIISSLRQINDTLNSAHFSSAKLVKALAPKAHLSNACKAQTALYKKNNALIDEFSAAYNSYENGRRQEAALLLTACRSLNDFYDNAVIIMVDTHNMLLEAALLPAPTKDSLLLEPPESSLDLTESPVPDGSSDALVKKVREEFVAGEFRGRVDNLNLHLNNILETIELHVIVPHAQQFAKREVSVQILSTEKRHVKVFGTSAMNDLGDSPLGGLSTDPKDGLAFDLDRIKSAVGSNRRQCGEILDVLGRLAREAELLADKNKER